MAEYLEWHHLDRLDPFHSRHPRSGIPLPSPRYSAWLLASESLILDNNGIPYGGAPPAYQSLELAPRNGITASSIVQSLPSPGHTSSGEFIGLTDTSNRSYSVRYQVIPSLPPPSYIDSTHQDQDVVVYLCSQSGHHLNRRSSESTLGTSSNISTARRVAATTLSRSSLDSPLAHPLFRSNN